MLYMAGAAAIELIGFILLAFFTDVTVALAVFLINWGANMGRRAR